MSPDKAQQIGNDLACIARTLAELAKEIKAEYDFDHDADDEQQRFLQPASPFDEP